jgi:hypothetical protein
MVGEFNKSETSVDIMTLIDSFIPLTCLMLTKILLSCLAMLDSDVINIKIILSKIINDEISIGRYNRTFVNFKY